MHPEKATGMEDDHSDREAMTLGDAVRKAANADWHIRLESVSDLVRHIHCDVAFEQLVVMLNDDDTAVIVAAVAGLVQSAGIKGLAKVLEVLASSEDEVGYFVRDKLVEMWLAGAPIIEFCNELIASDCPPLAREGASEMLDILNSKIG